MKATPLAAQSLRRHWVTGTRTPVCQNRHAYLSFKHLGNHTVLETRGDCHHFMTCGSCHQSAFGVQSGGHGIISWYAISKEQLEHMRSFDQDTKTWVFLEYLKYLDGGYEE